MHKKFLIGVMALTLSATALTGCGSGGSSDKDNDKDENTKIESSINEEDDESDKKNDKEKDKEKDKDKENDESKDGHKNEPTDTSDSFSGDVVSSSIDSPAKIGEWIKGSRYSAIDKEYHTVYFKITGVKRGQEAEDIVQAYNNSGKHAVIISDIDKDDIEHCVFEYDVYYPEDFPAADYGISSIDLDFSICNTKDSGAIGNYIGLSSTWKIGEKPDKFFPGDTYHGEVVFMMVKNFDDYLIKYSVLSNNDGEKSTEYIRVEK